MKKILTLLLLITFIACDKDNNYNPNTNIIVGTWLQTGFTTQEVGTGTKETNQMTECMKLNKIVASRSDYKSQGHITRTYYKDNKTECIQYRTESGQWDDLDNNTYRTTYLIPNSINTLKVIENIKFSNKNRTMTIILSSEDTIYKWVYIRE